MNLLPGIASEMDIREPAQAADGAMVQLVAAVQGARGECAGARARGTSRAPRGRVARRQATPLPSPRNFLQGRRDKFNKRI